jgi:chaperonin cofactor prefoldin
MPEQENVMNAVLEKLTRIETKIDVYKSQLDDHEARIRELEGKSGKKYDAVSLAIVTAVFVGIVGYVIGKLF